MLHGFDRRDGVAVAQSIEHALASQVDEAGGRFGESRAIDRIDAPAIDLAAGASPRAIGGAVAERLHGSMRA